MKTKFLTPTFLIFLLAILIFSSCDNNTTDQKQIAYRSGEILGQSIIKYYFIANEEIEYSNSYKMELASILSAEEEYLYPEKTFTLIENTDKKIKVFTEYVALLQELQKKESFNNNGIKLKIFTLLNELDGVYSSGDSLQMIKDYISAGKYDTDIAVAGVTEIMLKIWTKDVLECDSKLNDLYQEYATMTDQIPDDVFDESKLEKYVYEPYKEKTTLIKVYKLNLKQELHEQKSIFLNRIILLNNIFSELNGVYLKISQNIDDEHVKWANEQIYNSLKAFEENKN